MAGYGELKFYGEAICERYRAPLNVMYRNHSSPGVLQFPIGIHIIMLQLPLVCYKTNANKLNYHSLYRHTI